VEVMISEIFFRPKGAPPFSSMYCSMYTRAKFQFGNGFHLKLDVARPQVQVKEVLRDAPSLLPPANGFKA